MTNQVISANEGDRVKGLYRGIPYSGVIQHFSFNEKMVVVKACVILDSAIEGTHIMRREAGEGLLISHNADHSTLDVVA